MQILSATRRETPPTRHLAQGLYPLITILKQHGVNPKPLLEKANIPSSALENLVFFLTAEQELRFTELVIETLKRPDLGLTIGSKYHLAAYGTLGLAIMTSENLLAATKVAHKNTLMTWTYMDWTLSVEDNMAYTTLEPLLDLGPCYQFMVDRGLAASYQILKEALGRDLPLAEVSLTSEEPEYSHRYSEFFSCQIKFSAAQNGFKMDVPYLTEPLLQTDSSSNAIYCAEAEKICRQLEGGFQFKDLIRQHIAGFEGQQNNLEFIAEKFHATPRTIQRRLAAEGTSYKEILEDVRRGLAIDYLQSTDLTIESIASRLGYNDASAFCHAFKQWTGKNPGSFRGSQKA